MCPRLDSRPGAGGSDNNAEGRRQRACLPSKRSSPKRITAEMCRRSTDTNAAVERHRTRQRQRKTKRHNTVSRAHNTKERPTRSKRRRARLLPKRRRGHHDRSAGERDCYQNEGETNTIKAPASAAATQTKERPTRSKRRRARLLPKRRKDQHDRSAGERGCCSNEGETNTIEAPASAAVTQIKERPT